MADAVTRSHLPDGRVVGWYGEPGVVIDAEVSSLAPPLASGRPTRCGGLLVPLDHLGVPAKLADVPIAIWLREHELGSGPADVVTLTDLWPGVTVMRRTREAARLTSERDRPRARRDASSRSVRRRMTSSPALLRRGEP